MEAASDSQKKLQLNKQHCQRDDDEKFHQMAAGRRQLHFKELPKLPGEQLSESSSGRESVTSMNSELLLHTQGHQKRKKEPDSPQLVKSDTEREHPTRNISISDYEDNVFFNRASDASEAEKTCIVAFATIDNIRETTGDTLKQQLQDYLQSVFKLPKSRLQVLTEMAAHEESPELRLICRVMHARSLTAKDANGKSDPYCRLGILNEKHLESSLVKAKDLVHWKKEGWVSDVKTTSIKLATLDPDWNEEFELVIKNPKEEVMVLEIWDSDDEEIQHTSKIKGVKNIGNFLTDLKKGVDDFMGRCFHPIQSIPVSGEVKTFVLHSHSGKTKHGFVSLTLNIKGIKENTPVEVSVWEHTMLTRAMVNESSRSGGYYIHRWDGKLPEVAEKLLEQHALLNGLNMLQLAAVRLSVFNKYHKLYAMKMSTLKSLLQKIKEHKSFLPKTLTPDDLKRGGDKSKEWLVQMFSDLLELASDIEEIFRNHLMIFNPKIEKEVHKLEDNLIILRELYSFRPFVYQLPPEQRNLKDVLEVHIREATTRWFAIMEAKLLPIVGTPASELEAFRDLCLLCLNQCRVVMKKFGPMFMEEGVSYFSHFYITLDNLLGTKAESTLKSVEASVDTASMTFEIHVTFRKMSKLSIYIDKKVDVDLELSGSYSWFKPMVETWISLAIERCRTRIKKAIELNETVTADVKISTSAIDLCGFLLQVGEFWKNLDWPEPSVSFGLMVNMLQQMCDCAQYYVRELYESHSDKYDEEGKFLASEELSVALNNMHHVRTVVQQLPEKLKLQSFYDWLEEQASLGSNAKHMVDRVLASADEDIENRIRQIVENISEKLAPDILKCIEKVIDGPSDLPDTDTIAPLLNYLAVNLQTLGDYTYSEVFYRILLPIWNTCMDAIMKTLKDLKHQKTAVISLSSQRLTTLLDLLRQFFNADGNGLDLAEMNNDSYDEVMYELDVLKMDTESLILHFFSDLAGLQVEKTEKAEKGLGELLVSVVHNKEKDSLDVHVIQGRNLPVMDKDGACDPYVQLTLLPQWKYPESSKKTHKTQIEKSNLNPYFNKEFSIPVSEESMATEGGILLLTVFDHDVLTPDEYAGMCVIPLNKVPGIASCNDPSSPMQRNHTLPLFVISLDNMSKYLLELCVRSHKGDSLAATFVKVNRKILGNFKKLFKGKNRSSLYS